MPRATFAQWLGNLDRYMLGMAGVTHRDIADMPWRDWYDDEIGPKTAAREALAEEGFPFS